MRKTQEEFMNMKWELRNEKVFALIFFISVSGFSSFPSWLTSKSFQYFRKSGLWLNDPIITFSCSTSKCHHSWRFFQFFHLSMRKIILIKRWQLDANISRHSYSISMTKCSGNVCVCVYICTYQIYYSHFISLKIFTPFVWHAS